MPSPDWIATYRLQLNAEFPLAAAARVLPYLAGLGISHVYLSPVLQAAATSTHGYDVTDPTRVSEQLGGEPAWGRFVAAARANNLGILLDFVPNHMAVSAENPWWDDLLRFGPLSRYANFFDVTPRREDTRWLVHLCPLGRRYGEALAVGELQLVRRATGDVRVRYFEHSWPLCPETHTPLANAGDAELAALSADRERLHALLEQQHYRLHHWRLEGELTNYRRFFDVGTLVGVRMDRPEVFAACHARIRGMIERDELAGLRIDHPDGLADPRGYLQRLRERLPDGRIYVEKILDENETLRGDWPVDGGVGYEFLARVNRLWMDGQKSDALTALYSDFTKESVNFPAVVREKQRQVLERAFNADLERLTDLALALAQQDWAQRDLSRRQMREALARLTTALPVYRTYRPASADESEDLRLINDSLTAARMLATHVDAAVFDFLQQLLTRANPSGHERDFLRRWQQLSPAVAAKGIEDTTFYVYDRLVACNEVGAPASAIGIPTERFHEFCHHLGANWPHNLLATSTHDNKRSEDVRTRLAVLTEIPDRWGEAVHAWSVLNHDAWNHRTPDRHAEWLLYQTLVGAWPISEERCWAYMLKACREAKIRTSWHAPNAGYEDALRDFVHGLFASREFLGSLEKFVALVAPAGRTNSLAQTLVKLTAPGVPDFYQGTELWELSLVDPDNRRPVDYAQRVDFLSRLEHLTAADVMAAIDSGLPKLWLIARALAARRANAACFARGARYRPRIAQGTRTSHLLAFERGERVIVAVPRFTLTLGGAWEDTHLPLPEGRWRHVFTAAWLEGTAAAAQLFAEFPVAMLVREE
ncbi:MAG: malto-oligosyltrehalose synthase [Opitutae bacterium]|nr:malto-oligosyltrehalose synthase [Opitutae bacterium]